MTLETKAAVEFRQWLGLLSDVDDDAIPPGGTVEQVNLVSIQQNGIEVRGGMRQATFEN